jgi:hypothetical protein
MEHQPKKENEEFHNHIAAAITARVHIGRIGTLLKATLLQEVLTVLLHPVVCVQYFFPSLFGLPIQRGFKEVAHFKEHSPS